MLLKMIMNTYKALYNNLLNNIEIEDFIFIKKIKKRIKLTKVSLGLSYSMLIGSLAFASTEVGFSLIVAGLVLVLYFKDKIRFYLELINQNKQSFEDIIKPYIDSDKMKDFRKNQLSKLKTGSISKVEYLSIIKDEVNLLTSLIKRECIEDANINVVIYKNSIDNLLQTVKEGVESNLIEKEEFDFIKRKWFSDLQVLCNQYNKTDIEVELKYLCSKIK